MANEPPINCFKCAHYFVTWDPVNPRGCRYFSFKTAMMPSAYVLKSSGNPCGAFTPKRV